MTIQHGHIQDNRGGKGKSKQETKWEITLKCTNVESYGHYNRNKECAYNVPFVAMIYNFIHS